MKGTALEAFLALFALSLAFCMRRRVVLFEVEVLALAGEVVLVLVGEVVSELAGKAVSEPAGKAISELAGKVVSESAGEAVSELAGSKSGLRQVRVAGSPDLYSA